MTVRYVHEKTTKNYEKFVALGPGQPNSCIFGPIYLPLGFSKEPFEIEVPDK